MERLLCIKIASRGDLLLAAPAFRALRPARSRARITLLVGKSCEDMARHLPFFDEILTLDDRALLAGGLGEKLKAAWGLLSLLKANAWSEALIFHRDSRYGLIARLAGIRIRRGLQRTEGACFLTH